MMRYFSKTQPLNTAVLLLAMTITQAGCDWFGKKKEHPNPNPSPTSTYRPPELLSGLTYPSGILQNYTVGIAITPNHPRLAQGNAIHYSADILPSGLRIDPSTGIISGIPTQPNAWARVRITATSSTGLTAGTAIYLVVNPAPAPAPVRPPAPAPAPVRPPAPAPAPVRPPAPAPAPVPPPAPAPAPVPPPAPAPAPVPPPAQARQDEFRRENEEALHRLKNLTILQLFQEWNALDEHAKQNSPLSRRDFRELLEHGLIQDALWIVKLLRSELFLNMVNRLNAEAIPRAAAARHSLYALNLTVALLENSIQTCIHSREGREDRLAPNVGGANVNVGGVRNHYVLTYEGCQIPGWNIELGLLKAHFKQYIPLPEMTTLPHPTGLYTYPMNDDGIVQFLNYPLNAVHRGSEARSEYAAYLVDEALDLNFVPYSIWGNTPFYDRNGLLRNLTGNLQLHVAFQQNERGWARRPFDVKNPAVEDRSPRWNQEAVALGVFGYIIGNPDFYRDSHVPNGIDVNYFVWEPALPGYAEFKKLIAIDNSGAFRTSLGGFLDGAGGNTNLHSCDSLALSTWGFDGGRFNYGIRSANHAGLNLGNTHWNYRGILPQNELLWTYPIRLNSLPPRVEDRILQASTQIKIRNLMNSQVDLGNGPRALIDPTVGFNAARIGTPAHEKFQYFAPDWVIERLTAIQQLIIRR